jgi:hypothetical protein
VAGIAGWRERVAALLGISAYTSPKGYGPDIDSPAVVDIRESLGGQLSPLPQTRTRWYLADLETTQAAADVGDLRLVGQLYRTMRRDGTLAGLLSTRTSGLVRLPKRFYGKPEIVDALQSRNGSRSVFEEMFPPSELALLAADGIVAGVGIAEMCPVIGRDYPVAIRLDPEFLRYRWNENRWYYNSIAGPLPITPGDGRWLLHTPGGRISPWQSGLWPALGRAWINKEHAMLHRSNYGAKLANPARAAVAPLAATETQRAGFLQKLIAWGINTVFELPPGWDVKLIELKGEGYKVFAEDIQTSDLEFMIALAGQVVTTTGGTGFANADIHKSIRADLIKDTGDSLAYTINTQGFPPFIAQRWGVDALDEGAMVEWDVTPPRDQKAEADSMNALAVAMKALTEVLTPYGRQIDVDQLTARFGIPIAGDLNADGSPDEDAPAPAAPSANESEPAPAPAKEAA